MNDLESLMKDVARTVQADVRRKELLPKVQARLAGIDERAGDRPSGRRRAWPWVTLGGMACAAAIAVFALRPRPISYSLSGNGSAWALHFSDGSQVGLPAHAEASVDAVDENGATVAIAHGTVNVSVVHRARTRWRVRAGDYEIRVTGTRFAAGWSPDKRILTVGMQEGSVLVSGPGIATPVRLVGGQSLRATEQGPVVRDGLVAPDGADGEASQDAGAHRTAEHAAAAGAPFEAGAVAPAPTSGPPVRATHDEGVALGAQRSRRASAPSDHPTLLAKADSNWRVLAARAQYRAALETAVREGWASECGRLGSEDVILLGDVARLAGDAARAEEAYQAARRRFPTADRPIFGLGLIAFEVRHDYPTAGRWFAIYLGKFRGGPLAREAAGRLLESRLKAGDVGGAREAASSYLAAYPDGSHAALARRILASD